MKIIFVNVAADDFILAVRAAEWLISKPDVKKDAILVYGEGASERAFYARRNKSSITVRSA